MSRCDSADWQSGTKLDLNRIKSFVILKSVLLLEGLDILPANYFRASNKKRDKIGILRWAG